MTALLYLSIALGGGILIAFVIPAIISSARQKRIEDIVRQSEKNFPEPDTLKEFYNQDFPVIHQNEIA